jgi:hypothetical protein
VVASSAVKVLGIGMILAGTLMLGVALWWWAGVLFGAPVFFMLRTSPKHNSRKFTEFELQMVFNTRFTEI